MGKHDNKKHTQVQKPPRNFKFYLGSRERYIAISSDFDSGNIALVRQLSQFQVKKTQCQYRLTSVHDGTFTGHHVNSKSWFYFSVVGFPKNTKGKFMIAKVQTLSGMFYSKFANSYRPVYKIGETGQWQRLPTVAQLVMRQNGQLECVFQYAFHDENEKVYFAFCYPYSYSQNIKYLQSLSEYLYHDDFYYHQQVLIKSPQDRFIHLLTITSYDHRDKAQECQQLFDQRLFPQNNRPYKFAKPVVLISARVHPGQTPASYAMQGVIDFLTDRQDLRAHLLRKMFVFMIVPMINVDGVYNGHFRMDSYGNNLNRFYSDPDPHKQPAVYAIKELANHLNKENRLSFYFDLHAHNAKKGCFIYGNAINDFVEQVESQVFCKLFSMNNKIFQYQYCNFSERHMNARDRNEDMTKEGCGRVVMYRLANILHSYSLECGIVSANNMNVLPDPMNQEFRLDNKHLPKDECEDNNSPMYKMKGEDNPLFTIDMYRNLGKNLCVSILDVFDKNPYNRVYNSKYKSMDMLRRLTAFQIFHQAERFRMFERFIFGKVKKINDLIRDVLNTKLHYKKLYNFYFYDDKELKYVVWPVSIGGLLKPRSQSLSKMKRFRGSTAETTNKGGNEYSESFMEALANAKIKQQENQLQSIDLSKTHQKFQQQCGNQNDNSNSDSSETEDLSPMKKTKDLEEQEQKYERVFADEERQASNSTYFEDSPQKRNIVFSETLIDIYQNPRSTFYPQCIRSHYEIKQPNSFQDKSIKLIKIHEKKQSPEHYKKVQENSSVRVRRLLKCEAQNSTVKSDNHATNKANLTTSNLNGTTNQITMASEFRKNLYQSIKEQIRQGLRKEQQRKTIMNVEYTPIQYQGNKSVATDRKKGSGKCWSVKNYTNSKRSSRLQLPSLSSQMFIVSSSTKLVNKKH